MCFSTSSLICQGGENDRPRIQQTPIQMSDLRKHCRTPITDAGLLLPKVYAEGELRTQSRFGTAFGSTYCAYTYPHKIESKNNVLRWPQTASSPCRTDGIVGPRKAIRAEVINCRDWEEIVSSDGVRSYVSRVTAPALRDGGAP
jgi:hypothetical protein